MSILCCLHGGRTLRGLARRFPFSFEELSHLARDSNRLSSVTTFEMIVHRCCSRECRSMMPDFLLSILVTRQEL